MKKLIILSLGIFTSSLLIAQSGAKPVAKPKPKAVAAKPVTTGPVLKTLSDSASYAMGISLASFYKQQGVSKINTTLVSKAINDVMGGKKLLMDDMNANEVMNKLMTNMQESKAQACIDTGAAFLARNKKRPTVKTTASGLQYEVITEGTGIKPVATDSVTCHYKGTLIDGTEFDNSFSRGEPITFALNRVIPGWTEGVQLMSEGAKYKFYIPYTIAYGAFDNGPIPGGSTLIFDVELIKVIKN
jgi:FKBP-type peptidyl-prolyl cis-trans isomerase